MGDGRGRWEMGEGTSHILFYTTICYGSDEAKDHNRHHSIRHGKQNDARRVHVVCQEFFKPLCAHRALQSVPCTLCLARILGILLVPRLPANRVNGRRQRPSKFGDDLLSHRGPPVHDVNGHRLHRSESREERAGDDELAERGEVACLRHRVIHDKLEDVQGQYNGKAQRRSIVQISRRQEEAFEIKREREREIVWKSAPLPLAASGHVPYLTQLITVSSATTKVKFSICGREKCRRREKPRRESQITWTFQRKRKPIFL